MRSRQRLTIARDLLTGDVRQSTQVNVYDFTLRPVAARGDVWAVYDERHEAPVDYVNISATTSAVELLGHLEKLRDCVERSAVDEVKA